MKKNRLSVWKSVRFLLRPWLQENAKLVIGYILILSLFPPISVYLYTVLPQESFLALDEGGLRPAILCFLFYMLIGFLCDLIPRVFNAQYYWRSTAIEGKLEERIYAKALATDQAYLESPDFYDSYRLTAESFVDKSSYAIEHLTSILNSLLTSIFMGTLIFVQGGWALILVLLFSVFAIFANILWANLNSDRSIQSVVPERKGDYIRRLFYEPNVVSDLKVSNIRKPLHQMFTHSVKDRMAIYRSFFSREFAVDLCIVIGNLGAIAIVPLYSIVQYAKTGRFDIGTFSTLLLASTRLKASLNELGWWMSQLSADAQYGQRMMEFFEKESTIEASQEGIEPSTEPFCVEIRNLTFQYSGNTDFSLSIDHLRIDSGKKIAIVGENGAGKSTLFKLLLRLYEADSGEILYNGVGIAEYQLDALRRSIGVAMQKPVIYALTASENASAYHEISDEELAVLYDQLHLPIEPQTQLTKEFDAEGRVLSGGQQQKLALSRLMHGSFNLLLFDEPNASLDPFAEKEVADLIHDIPNTTSILVAHRLSLVKDADYIYVMRNGSIRESGTHAELMKKQGIYYEMYESQARSYEYEVPSPEHPDFS